MKSSLIDLDNLEDPNNSISVTQVCYLNDNIHRLFTHSSEVIQLPDIDEYMDPTYTQNWDCTNVFECATEERPDLKENLKRAKKIYKYKCSNLENQAEDEELLNYDYPLEEQAQLNKLARHENEGFAQFNLDGSLRFANELNDIDYSDLSNDSMEMTQKQEYVYDSSNYVSLEPYELEDRYRLQYGKYWETALEETDDFAISDSTLESVKSIYHTTNVRQNLKQIMYSCTINENTQIFEPSMMLEHELLERAPPCPSANEFGYFLEYEFEVEVEYSYDINFEILNNEKHSEKMILCREQHGGWVFALYNHIELENQFSCVCPIVSKFELVSASECINHIALPEYTEAYVLIIEGQAIVFKSSELVLGQINSCLLLAYQDVVGKFNDELGSCYELTSLLTNRYESCVAIKHLCRPTVFAINLQEFCLELDSFNEYEEQQQLSLIFLKLCRSSPICKQKFIKDVYECCVEKIINIDAIIQYLELYPCCKNYNFLNNAMSDRYLYFCLENSIESVAATFPPQELYAEFEMSKRINAIPKNAPRLGYLSVCYVSNEIIETYEINQVCELEIDITSKQFYLFIRLLPYIKQEISSIEATYQKIIDIINFQFQEDMEMRFSYFESSHTGIIWLTNVSDNVDISSYYKYYGTDVFEIKELHSFSYENLFIATHFKFINNQLEILVHRDTLLPYLRQYGEDIPLDIIQSELNTPFKDAEAYINILQYNTHFVSLALNPLLESVEEYIYQPFECSMIDLGGIINDQLFKELIPSFCEYLQMLNYTDLQLSQLTEQPNQAFTLPIDSDSESTDELPVEIDFLPTKDVEYAIEYHYDNIDASFEDNSFLAAFYLTIGKYSAIQQVWWAKSSGKYEQKYVADDLEDQLDELQSLGLFFPNYECQFKTPLKINKASAEFLRCHTKLPVESVQQPVRAGCKILSKLEGLVKK